MQVSLVFIYVWLCVTIRVPWLGAVNIRVKRSVEQIKWWQPAQFVLVIQLTHLHKIHRSILVRVRYKIYVRPFCLVIKWQWIFNCYYDWSNANTITKMLLVITVYQSSFNLSQKKTRFMGQLYTKSQLPELFFLVALVSAERKEKWSTVLSPKHRFTI